MNTIRVTSSNIESVGYEPGEQRLRIIFHRGGAYDYVGVSAQVFESLIQAPSVGKHFIAHVKDVYPHTRVTIGESK